MAIYNKLKKLEMIVNSNNNKVWSVQNQKVLSVCC